MKTLKFRWFDPQGVHYRTIILPDNAQQMLYVDEYGVEVYENELVFDGENQNFAENVIFPAPAEQISLDGTEISRAHKEPTWRGVPFNEHIPLYLSRQGTIEKQADGLNDKLFRDARLGFSKSVFDLLPDLSELRDVD